MHLQSLPGAAHHSALPLAEAMQLDSGAGKQPVSHVSMPGQGSQGAAPPAAAAAEPEAARGTPAMAAAAVYRAPKFLIEAPGAKTSRRAPSGSCGGSAGGATSTWGSASMDGSAHSRAASGGGSSTSDRAPLLAHSGHRVQLPSDAGSAAASASLSAAPHAPAPPARQRPEAPAAAPLLEQALEGVLQQLRLQGSEPRLARSKQVRWVSTNTAHS